MATRSSGAAAKTPKGPSSKAQSEGRAPSFFSRYMIYFVFVAMCLYAWFRCEHFNDPQNLLNVGQQSAVNLIIAVGMTFVIISGGIDLSVGSVVALAGVATVATITSTPVVALLGPWALPLGILLGLVIGLAAGAFSGAVISRLRVPPFIVTLAVMVMGRGAVKLYTKGVPIGVPDPGTPFEGTKNALLTKLGMVIGGQPGSETSGMQSMLINIAPLVAAAVIAVIGYILLTRTSFGRRVYAIGGNEPAARLSGININRVKLGIYALAGVCAALGGIMDAAGTCSGSPIAGDGYELNAIAAAVVGGTSLAGGRGAIAGTVLGALIFGVLNNILNLKGYSTFLQEVARGAVILIAVVLDRVMKDD